MEPEMAVRMWTCSGDYGIHFNVQIGDEDSATQNRLQKDVPTNLQPTQKKSDFLHIKRNFSNHLFKFKPKYKKVLSKAVIIKLMGDFGAALKTNVGDVDKIKAALENIIPHNYGEHINCGDWCKTKIDSNHSPKLPYGKYLSDKELRKDLEQEIATWTTPETLVKIADCSSSQGTEQAFSMLSKLAPKDLHLSSSPTLQQRVHHLVARYNEGKGYGGLLWRKIGIKDGTYQRKSYTNWQRTQFRQRGYKQQEAFKIQRRVLKHQRTMRTRTQKQNETLQYKSGMGLEVTSTERREIGEKRKRRTGEELAVAKRFKCGSVNCTKSYTSKSGLIKHQKTKHINVR
jgi:hypothetical protein